MMGRSERVGEVEISRLANLIAVARVPLADITELERVRFAMTDGSVHRDELSRRP